ncbi:TonB-dependent receptor [Methylomonas sp. UP202]|uniref:TonB-dependent siderophore receptor n=1 Tax=Methylomonas sp. UP202 TaxID=3040943 RepID=UPI002479A9CB|nr:TonB-dependent receptor [Methylomonas sp. UP202]WGS85759.1 TonB-dependent receptor [Methylomonas sp. UP202]
MKQKEKLKSKAAKAGFAERRGRVPIYALVGGLLLAGMSTAEEAFFRFDIAEPTLEVALQALGRQTGMSIFYTEASVAGRAAPEIHDRLTVTEALSRLLKTSGLSFRVLNDQSISIRPAPPIRPPKSLPPVNVTAMAPAGPVEEEAAVYARPVAATGTKLDTPLMATPLNVQVLPAEVLRDQQVVRLDQAMKNFSGVTSTKALDGLGAFGEQFYLRGFPATTLFRNGFRMDGNAFGNGQQFANVDSIEVLKGPAAMLYGRVEPGGIVNVITKQPKAVPLYAFSQQFGSFDLFRTSLDATGPLDADRRLLYRLNASAQTSHSFRDLDSDQDLFLAPVLSWRPSPATQINLELEYQTSRSSLDKTVLPFRDNRALDLPANVNFGERNPLHAENYFVGLSYAHDFDEHWAIKHRVNFKRQDFRYQNAVLPIGFDAEARSVIRGVNSAQVIEDSLASGLDLIGRFTTGPVKHNLLLGGDYYYEYGFAELTSFDNSTIDFQADRRASSEIIVDTPVSRDRANNYFDHFGVYVQDQIELPGRVHVLGGLRYQSVANHWDGKSVDFNSGETLSFKESYPADSGVTPRIGLLWQPSGWLSVYGNYVENFGASNAGFTSPQHRPLPPESARQWEMGVKGEWLDRRLRMTLAYFDLTKQGVRISNTANSPACGDITVCSIAAGEIESRGPELEVVGEILPGWNVIANYANLDVRIIRGDARNGGLFATGNRPMNVPRNLGSVWTTFRIDAGLFRGCKFGGGIELRDSVVNDSNAYRSPGYALLSLVGSYGVNWGKTKLLLQLNVENLTDSRYVTNVSPQGDPTGLALATFGTPRALMGLLRLEY